MFVLIALYTYRFFVSPLYTEKHKTYLDSFTQALIENTFGKGYVNDGFMKTVIRKVPLFRGHYLKQFKETSQADLVHEITDWNMEALLKMRDTCSERNIVFRVIPAPLADIEKKLWVGKNAKTDSTKWLGRDYGRFC